MQSTQDNQATDVKAASDIKTVHTEEEISEPLGLQSASGSFAGTFGDYTRTIGNMCQFQSDKYLFCLDEEQFTCNENVSLSIGYQHVY